MKLIKIVIASALLLFSAEYASAQSVKKAVKIEDKKVEYKNENGTRTLTIITKEKGREKKEVYTGDEADRRMEEMNAEGSTQHFKVWTDDNEVKVEQFKGAGDEQDVQVFTDEGSVSVIHKDGKVIIRKKDKDGKEEVEEIEIGDDARDILNDLHFRVDSNQFAFDFDQEKFQQRMERFGKDMEERMKSFEGKSYFFDQLNPNGNESGSSLIVKEETETLTPEEIKRKYDVDVAPGTSDQTVIIKKVITVKGSNTDKNPANNSSELSVYPNPGNGNLNFSYNAPDGGLTRVELKDAKGSVVYTTEYKIKGRIEKTIDVSHLSSGNYLLEIRNGGKVSSQKVFVDQ